MKIRNKIINSILIVISFILIFVSIFLRILNITSWIFFSGVLFGVLISWIYTLTSMYSTKLIFKTENPFLQLGFSVLKIGIIFFTTFLVVWLFNSKLILYGILLGLILIPVYFVTSSFVYIIKRR